MDDRTTQLLRNGLAGDREGYSAFVARITPLLIAVARRYAGALATRGIGPEDIVQDAWLQSLPHLHRLQPVGGRITPVVVKYLSVAVRRRSRDLLIAVAHGRTQPLQPVIAGLTDESVGIVTRVILAEQRSAVLTAIESLDPIDRNALVLLSIEQLPLDEAAAILGIGKDAAKQRHHRARQRLLALLPSSVFEELD